MLTEKCKKEFFDFRYKNVKWNEEDVQMFYEDTLIEQQAWMVAFFDTVDIYVNALRYNKTYFQPLCNHLLHEKYETRSEALKQAFMQANKIYNERV